MNITQRLLLSVSAVGLAFCGPAQGETLSDAISAAIATNPQLGIQRQQSDLAAESLEQARAQGRTTVDLSASAGHQYTDTTAFFGFNLGDHPIVSAQIQATKPIYTGGSIAAGVRQAKAGVEAANSQYDAAVQDLILNVITAYEDVRRDREAVIIRENNVEVSNEQVRAAQDRFDVGVVTRTDVSLAQARYEGTRASLAGAEASLEASIANYVVLTGMMPGELAPPPPIPQLPADLEEAYQIALDSNPDLEAARHAERAANEAIKAAKGQYRPQVAIVGTASQQKTYNDGQRDTSASILAQGTIPLFSGGLIKSQVKSARLERDQARQQIDLLQRQIRSQVAQAWYGYAAAEKAIEASARQVDASEIAYEGAKEELSVGLRTTLDVLDQEQQLFEARLALVEAERDAYVAAHSLLRAIGQLNPR